MLKKGLGLIVIIVLISIVAAGCFDTGSGNLKIGMVTDSGTIDDKSFNQGTWEGVQRAGKEMKLEIKYLKPTGTTEADYVKEISNLYDAGYRFIVCPGFKFETAIYQTQSKYKDAKFVLIDGSPRDKDGNAVIAKNTVSITFAENEAGFAVGLAAALQLKVGEVGFIGGMEIPPVQKYNWGFQQGIQYANTNLGTKITLKSENVIYQGSFNDVNAGQQLAAQMYDKGVKAIFCAAGGVGVGAINEAKTRAKAGQQVWVIGVDVDQYSEGIYEGNKSVLLTSAMKKIDQASFDMIKAEKDGKFPGGKSIILNSKTNGVGIPTKNPNLSAEVQKQVSEVLVKAGVKISAQKGNLIK